MITRSKQKEWNLCVINECSQCSTEGFHTIRPNAVMQKSAGKSKQNLALEMMMYCTFVLRIKPNAWLFDSLYASEKILWHTT